MPSTSSFPPPFRHGSNPPGRRSRHCPAGALIARSVDGGMTEEMAERAARNSKKVAADLAVIDVQWAQLYLAKRQA